MKNFKQFMACLAIAFLLWLAQQTDRDPLTMQRHMPIHDSICPMCSHKTNVPKLK